MARHAGGAPADPPQAEGVPLTVSGRRGGKTEEESPVPGSAASVALVCRIIWSWKMEVEAETEDTHDERSPEADFLRKRKRNSGTHNGPLRFRRARHYEPGDRDHERHAAAAASHRNALRGRDRGARRGTQRGHGAGQDHRERIKARGSPGSGSTGAGFGITAGSRGRGTRARERDRFLVPWPVTIASGQRTLGTAGSLK